MKVILALERLRQENHIQGQPIHYSQNLFQQQQQQRGKWGWQDSSVVKDTAALVEVPFPGPKQQLPTIWEFSSRGSKALFGPPWELGLKVMYRHRCRPNTQIQTTKTQLGKGTDSGVQWVGHLSLA